MARQHDGFTDESHNLWHICLLALMWFWLPLAPAAQSFDVLHDGLFRVGNYWQFDTSTGGTPFTTTWEMVRTEQVGDRLTVVLQESTPGRLADINVYLSATAMTIARISETQQTVPPIHITATFSNHLEKIPRTVNATDVRRSLGRGEWVRRVVEDPTQQWTAVQDQFVTFDSLQTVTVPAGTFSTTVFRVEENWTFSTGWTGTARRAYFMHAVFGFIAMNYEVAEFRPDGTLFSQTFVTNQLRFFLPGITDLEVNQGSLSPTSALAGDTVTISWREIALYRNAAAHVTDVYLTTDTTVTGADTRLISATPIPEIASGLFHDVVKSVAIPPRTRSDQYRVAIVVDALSEVIELNERNTFLLGALLSVTARPDLTVSGGSVTPASLAPGEVLSISVTIANTGGESAPPTRANLYLSANATIDTSDYLLVANIDVPTLAPAGQYRFERSVFVPTSFPGGTYRVLVEVDAGNAVIEVDEGNNVAALSQTVLIGSPDLRVTGGWFSPSGVQPGRPITVQATVVNTGTIAAGANWIHVYLSTDTLVGAGDVALEDGLRSPSLNSGSTVIVNANPTIPTGTPLGAYHILVVSDALDEIVESNESNNALALPGTLEVTTPPDLQARHLDFAPMAVNGGDPIAIVGYICNASGAATTTSFWVEFLVSPNDDFSSPRLLLCESALIPPLGMGREFALQLLQHTLYSVAPGRYTFGIRIDATDRVAESNENNNLVWVSHRRLFIGVQPSRASRWALYR